MRRVRLIGTGSGHPDQLTLEAIEALKSVSFVIAAEKPQQHGDDPLLSVRAEIADRYNVKLVAVRDPERDRNDPADYPGAVKDWHEARAIAYENVLRDNEGDAAFLVWGDPAFYDSTIRIVERIHTRGNVEFDYDVLPGISSLQVLAARHRIVLHEVGKAVLITTGRRLKEDSKSNDNLLVMLDGSLQCTELEGDWQIWWGANLGAPSEVIASGRLADVLPAIETKRAETKAATGWVMDTYLLRRIH